jgi:hypothetical protein
MIFDIINVDRADCPMLLQSRARENHNGYDERSPFIIKGACRADMC